MMGFAKTELQLNILILFFFTGQLNNSVPDSAILRRSYAMHNLQHLHYSSDLKRYLGGERVSVINDRHAVVSVPAVQLDAPAALQQDLPSTRTCRLRALLCFGGWRC